MPFYFNSFQTRADHAIQIYFKATNLLQQTFHNEDFTTIDCSILLIAIFLSANIEQLKVPKSSSSVFAGVPCLIYGPIFYKIYYNLQQIRITLVKLLIVY